MPSYPEGSHNYGSPLLSWKGVTIMKYLRLLFLVKITVAISSVLLISGCGDDDNNILVPKTSWQKEIGPAGGTVVVTERSSPIYGVKIEIPAGALAQKATIIISESENVSAPTLPAGITSDYPNVKISSTEPFLNNIKITFPVWNIPISDEEILSAFYLQTDNAAWTIVIPTQIKDKQMIITTDHLSLWRWGVISLDEVDLETITAAMAEIFYVGDVNELRTVVENKIAPFTSTFDSWIDYFNHWNRCADRQAVADILNHIIQVTEAGITEYLGTQSVIDACDPVYVCELNHMLLTDEQGRLMKWAEVEIRALFGEAFWSMLPGFGKGVAGDVLMELLGKALIEAQYRGAVKYELGCDYRCIFKNGNFNFYVNVLVCNISYLALFGMEVYEYHDPCTP